MKVTKLKKILFLSALFIYITSASSQALRGETLKHDIGIYVGYTGIQTDYGARYNIPSSTTLASLSYSIAHSLYFYDLENSWLRRSKLKKHLILRTSFGYESKRNLEHKGEWVEGASTPGKTLLRAMKGSVVGYRVGMDFEYHFRDLSVFNGEIKRRHRLSPYISTGIRLFMYENTLTSDLGDWTTDNTLLPPKYRPEEARRIGTGKALGLGLSTGFRYNLLRNLDLDAKISWHLYNSDYIDGVNADVSENRNNESTTSIQIGVIYRIRRNAFLGCF